MDAFPADFVWGAATAAYQIEGAAATDGRKPSVWDTFSATPGRVVGGDTGMVACDHYHRVEDDVALMASLGLKHYRFSISWPRILPDGTGAVNQAGLDFYKRLLDALQRHGITPHATLFHWDSPQALEDRYGSWRDRRMATDFAEYATVVVKALGDRIQDWMTINEIMCFTKFGYGLGKPGFHAPGTAVGSRAEISQTVHHALLAHGLGCQAIRAATPRPCRVALVDNYAAPVPVCETPENLAAVRKAFRHRNGDILVPALTGDYHWALFDDPDMAAPYDIRDGDLQTIAQPLDRLGFNVYTGFHVVPADDARGFRILDLPPGYPRLDMPWLHIVPEALYWGVRMVSESLGRTDLPIYISENGAACQDQLQGDQVWDTDRIHYLRSYLSWALRGVSEGLPLKGYFAWSLMDNYEWAAGYAKRFGLVYNDYGTQRRTPKASARWYSQLMRTGRLP
jgi:beta-glucosidase